MQPGARMPPWVTVDRLESPGASVLRRSTTVFTSVADKAVQTTGVDISWPRAVTRRAAENLVRSAGRNRWVAVDSSEDNSSAVIKDEEEHQAPQASTRYAGCRRAIPESEILLTPIKIEK